MQLTDFILQVNTDDGGAEKANITGTTETVNDTLDLLDHLGIGGGDIRGKIKEATYIPK